MAHISISPTKGATTFTPLAKAFNRTTKDGDVPVVNFLVGSNYNVKVGGEISITSTGNITNDSFKAISGKAEVALESTDGTEVSKIGTFTSFMYMFPGTKLVGHLELQDDNVGSGPVPIQQIRYIFQDLATNDKIEIILSGGDGNANLVLKETVSSVETTHVTQQLTAGVKEIFFELDYLEDGVSKFYYKEPSGSKTRIFNGALNADIGEVQVKLQANLDQQTLKTLKSDLIWMFYPNLFVGYDIPTLTDKTKGRIRIFDTNNEADEADWTEVFSSDHKFTGERVIENGLIRIWFKPTPKMEVYGWNFDNLAWETIGSAIPKSSLNDIATTLHDIVFISFNDGHVKLRARYGIVDHIVDMKRGLASVRIVANSTKFRVNTAKRRFVLSTDVNTDIPDFNQENSDDANRGNPLNLSSPVTTFTFTDDSNVNTGLDLMDDNWYAWYNENSSSDVVGFLANAAAPTSMSVSAVSATELDNIDWGFSLTNNIVTIGVLHSDPTTKIGAVPLPFHIGDPDKYVKWRAGEGLLGFNQRPFLRKKR